MTLELTLDFDEITKAARALGATPDVIAKEMTISMQASLDTFEQAVAVETPVNTGTLRNSIGTIIYGEPPDFSGAVATSIYYAMPVEYGRAPGKMPPVDAIKYWVIRKGIAPADEADSVAFLIARAIGRRGTKGAFMFKKGFETATPRVEKYWDQALDRILARMAS